MKTILLADDDANLRTLLRTTLDDPEYRVLEAADGTTALELAGKERPDLVVLDWTMPGMSGLEVAKALGQDPATAHIPVIMLTAKGQEMDKEQWRAIGVYAYLIRPFSPLELLEEVEEALGVKDRRYLKSGEPHSQAASRGGDSEVKLMVVEGPDKGKVLYAETPPVSIGRAPDNDIHIPRDRKMSRRHARIVKVQSGYFLEDLGSTNGTFYQGVRITSRVEIFHGDVFKCGETTFRFVAKRGGTTTVVASPTGGTK